MIADRLRAALYRGALPLLCLCSLGTAQGAEAPGWLQQRMERVALAAGIYADPVRAQASDDADLRLDQQADLITVPRALIALAPSPEAMDGLLALLLSYNLPLKPDPHDGRGNGITLSGGSAGTSGPGWEDGRHGGVSGAAGQPDPASQRKQKIWRGMGWYARTRGCTAQVIDYLRLIADGGSADVAGKSITWRGSRSGRTLLNDLGSLAYPSGEVCPARPDPDFDRARAEAAAAVVPAAPLSGPPLDP